MVKRHANVAAIIVTAPFGPLRTVRFMGSVVPGFPPDPIGNAVHGGRRKRTTSRPVSTGSDSLAEVHKQQELAWAIRRFGGHRGRRHEMRAYDTHLALRTASIVVWRR